MNMATATLQDPMTFFSIGVPSVDLARFKGIVAAMGWSLSKQGVVDASQYSEWTEEEERVAFLQTSRANASKIMGKYL